MSLNETETIERFYTVKQLDQTYLEIAAWESPMFYDSYDIYLYILEHESILSYRRFG